MADAELNSPHRPDGHFERLFKSDRSWLLKVFGAGVFALAIAIRILWRDRNTVPLSDRISTLIVVPMLVMLAAGALVRADAVRSQLRAGGPVGPFSRLFFASGIWSLLIWVVGALLIGFPLAIWLGSLTFERPAG